VLLRLKELARSPLKRLAGSLVLALVASLVIMALLTAAGMRRCGLADPGLWPAAGLSMVTDQLAEAGFCLNGNSPRPVAYGDPVSIVTVDPAVHLGGCVVDCSSPRWACSPPTSRLDL